MGKLLEKDPILENIVLKFRKLHVIYSLCNPEKKKQLKDSGIYMDIIGAGLMVFIN